MTLPDIGWRGTPPADERCSRENVMPWNGGVNEAHTSAPHTPHPIRTRKGAPRYGGSPSWRRAPGTSYFPEPVSSMVIFVFMVWVPALIAVSVSIFTTPETGTSLHVQTFTVPSVGAGLVATILTFTQWQG